MNKYAIYATVKTIDELILPFAGGIITTIVWGKYGFLAVLVVFICGVLFNIAFKNFGGWLLKKLDIPNY